MQEGDGIDPTAFPQLTPKPTPRPLPQNEQQKQRIIDEKTEEYRRNRMMAFMDNFGPQELPDPNNEDFRAQMRRRLLYSEPPPLEEFSRDRNEDVEFDVFEHLVLTIRYILHLRYKVGERLQDEDQLILLEEAIPYHPERDFKVGCGIAYIKVDIHPEFGSRCFFIVRTDGSEIDFSYRKCMMGLASARPEISEERARDLIYFFRTTGGQRLPIIKSL